MTTASNMESQRERDKKIKKAREALRECQRDRDNYMRRNPDAAEVKRVFEAEITKRNTALDLLLRGGA